MNWSSYTAGYWPAAGRGNPYCRCTKRHRARTNNSWTHSNTRALQRCRRFRPRPTARSGTSKDLDRSNSYNPPRSARQSQRQTAVRPQAPAARLLLHATSWNSIITLALAMGRGAEPIVVRSSAGEKCPKGHDRRHETAGVDSDRALATSRSTSAWIRSASPAASFGIRCLRRYEPAASRRRASSAKSVTSAERFPPNSLSASARSARFVSASTETENVSVAPARLDFLAFMLSV